MSPEGREALLAAARTAREKAHAPYSGFKVGAAVLTADGEIHDGCNIENAAYGSTMCAERVAAFKARSAGPTPIRAVAIVATPGTPCPPCGACRQVLLELAREAEVVLEDGEDLRVLTVRDLLPLGFGAEALDR